MKKLFSALSLAALTAFGAMAWDTPTMGWSSWNAFGHRINEEIIRSQADAMVSTGLREAGYKYINIDDGAWCGRDAEGHLVIHPTRFPNGLKELVDHIHAQGLKAGTYSDAGHNTCASFWGGDVDGIGTGLYEHDTDDANFMFRELGFDFIKVDFCGGDGPQNSEHLDLDERERYTAISEAIRATGRTDVRYNVCRWAYPGTWVEDVATSWRMSQDIYLGWESVKDIIRQNLYLSAYARHGKYNDMDMLEIGRGLTAEEDMTHMAMWCMLSSPLLIGCDLREISDETVALLSHPELLALNQDPLGLQATVVSRSGECYVLVKDVETLNSTTRAIAFYNSSDREAVISVDFFDIDLGGDVKVRDITARKELGTFADRFSATVPAHGTRVYRLEGAERMERIVYEGETGRIEAYQELENNQAVHTGVYEELDICSGGAKACWLGNREDNTLSWDNVHSTSGGVYDISIRFISGADRVINVDLNGTRIASLKANSGDWNRPGTVEFKATLLAGDNTITLSSASDWMPDIDCMLVIKEGSLDYYRHLHSAALNAVRAISLEQLPAGLQANFNSLIEANASPAPSRETYTAAADALNALRAEILAAIDTYKGYTALLEVAAANASATEPCSALDTFKSTITKCESDMAALTSADGISSIVASLRTAMRTLLTSPEAQVKSGMTWQADILINNPAFDTDTSGWSGNAAWGHGCAEHWNKSFTTSQTLTGLKNGYYTLRARALYRREANDGGTQYRSGSEKIDARLSANDANVPVNSLYAHPLADTPELEAVLSGTHVLKGYVNSMYGASMAFSHGLYDHEIADVHVTDGTLRITISCPTSTYDCWCCFDDFRLTYSGENPSGIEAVEADSGELTGPVYNLQGIRVAESLENARELPAGIYIVNGHKILR